MAVETQPGMAMAEEDQGAVYRRDGFLIVPALYEPKEMGTWKETIVSLLREEGSLNSNPSGVRVWMADKLDPSLRERMRDPAVVRILERLIGPDVEFLSVKAVYKNDHTTFGSPWHQDRFYWGGPHKLSVWIALDDATPGNGCLKLIPGSHRSLYEPRQVEDGKGFGRRIAEEDMVGQDIVSAPVRRGDAVFFDDHTVHASHPNVSGTDRWSFIATYRDASVPDESTVWKAPMLVSGRSVNGAVSG